MTLQNKADSVSFNQFESTSLRCSLSGISIANVHSLRWLKDGAPVKETNSPVGSFLIDYKQMRLELKNMSYETHNGIYHCVVELKNKQSLHSNILQVKINCNQKNFFK